MHDKQVLPDDDSLYISDVQEVEAEAPIQWIKKGWEDIKACPQASLFYGVCFVVGGYLMIFALRGAPEYIAAVIMGFVIMGPFLALGLYEISAQRERGEQCRLLPSLIACQKNVRQMSMFAMLLVVVFLLWAQVSVVVFAAFYSGELPTMGEFLKHVAMTEQLDFLLVYFSVGFIFVFIIFGVSLISIPLIKDRQMGAISAAIVSVRALVSNPLPMIVWSCLITALSLFGIATLLLGTLVAGPLLGHATWHAYRDLTGTTMRRVTR